MWIGLNKNLSGGVRVDTRTGSYKGCKRKQTQDKFINKIINETNQHVKTYLTNNNIHLAYAYRKRLNLDRLLQKKTAPQYQAVKKNINELHENISKINYEKNLTEERKNEIIDQMFELRKIIVSSESAGLNKIFAEIMENYTKKSLIAFLFFFFTITTLIGLESMGMGRESSVNKSTLDTLIPLVGTGIISAALYFPIHLIIKLLAKIKYNKQSIAIMKKHYEL